MEKVLDEASQKAGSAAKEVLELSRGELRVLAAEWGWGRGSWAYLEVEHKDTRIQRWTQGLVSAHFPSRCGPRCPG